MFGMLKKTLDGMESGITAIILEGFEALKSKLKGNTGISNPNSSEEPMQT